jgi:hypothetical protein
MIDGRFILRIQTGSDGFFIHGLGQPWSCHYNLVLARNGCAGWENIHILLSTLLRSIKALLSAQPFHLAMIRPNYITYALVRDRVVVSLDTPYGSLLSVQLNVRRTGNSPHVLPEITTFINKQRATTICIQYGCDNATHWG